MSTTKTAPMYTGNAVIGQQVTSDGTNWNLQSKSLLDVRDYSGATTSDKVNAAIAALGGNPGAIVIAPTLSGNSGDGTFLDKTGALDLRGLSGPDPGGNNAAYLSTFLFRNRMTAPGLYNHGTMEIYSEPFAGGQNDIITGKTNYYTLELVGCARTQGQYTALNINHNHYSNGDTFGVGAVVQSWGGLNTGGDEGTTGIEGVCYQGDTEFSGTISNISGTTITFVSTAYSDTRGENRPLLNSTTAYTTGSIASISGAVVTGSGTSWSSFGLGAHTDLWFALDSETHSGLRYCVPVASVDSDTQITLVTSYAGQTSTGTYSIFHGSLVNSLITTGGNINTGQLVVASATPFSIGNSFFQPLDYRYSARALSGILWKHVGPITDVGCQINNIGTLPAVCAFEATGSYINAILFPANVTASQSVVNCEANAQVQWYVSDLNDNATKALFLINRNTGSGTAQFGYNRSNDVWYFASQLASIDETKGGANFGISATNGTSSGYALSAAAYPNYTDGLQILPANNTTSRILTSQFGGAYYYGFNHQYAMFGEGIKLQGGTGNIGQHTANISSPTWQLDGATGAANFKALNVPLSTPASSSATGTAGDVKWDDSYVYICTATNTWKRAALATF